MGVKKPYPFQEEIINKCIDYLDGVCKDPVGVVVPTSGGKSLILSEIAKRTGRKMLVLQPSLELLQQNMSEAIELGCENIFVYSAGMGIKELGEGLIFATLGSIKNEAKTLKKLGIDILLVDEIHTNFSEKKGSEFRVFLKEFSPKKVIGFTATPYKLTSTKAGAKLKMLNRIPNKFIKDIIHVTQIKEIIDGGFWTPIEYEVHNFDDSGLILNSTCQGFTNESISSSLSAQGVNNNIYLRVKQLLKEGMTSILVFVDSLEVAEKLSQYVSDSAFVSGDTNAKERDRIVSEFKECKIKVIFNFGIFTTGFNHPKLQCVILGRPTNSLSLYYQIIGRVVRLHKSKSVGLVIDFCGNFNRFGRVEDQEIVDYPGHGWAVFCKDKLVTNVFLNGIYKIFKSDIGARRKFITDSVLLTFGKFKGKTLQQIKKSALWYLVYIHNNFEFDTPEKICMKEEIETILKEEALS